MNFRTFTTEIKRIKYGIFSDTSAAINDKQKFLSLEQAKSRSKTSSLFNGCREGEFYKNI